VTPSGLEKGRNVTEARAVTHLPTEPSAVERHAVARRCNECNDTLAGAREVIGTARRLAIVAMSAVMNGDPHRTRDVLDQLQSVLAAQDERAPSESLSERRLR
jgi:hypothetical protein